MTSTKVLSPGALRMRRLRHALNFKSAAAFARYLGISENRWINFENGYPLPREMVFLLREKIDGLTTDWIYFGNSRGLPIDLAERLGVLSANTIPKRRKRGTR